MAPPFTSIASHALLRSNIAVAAQDLLWEATHILASTPPREGLHEEVRLVGRRTADSERSGGSPSEREGHIFISYATEDRERARRLAEYLESRGWSVWWDRNIPVGRAFDEVIEEALRVARCAVVLWSKAGVASRWVRSEASDAARRDILVPVLLEDVTIPLEFRLFQALDLREWISATDTSALAALHDAISRIVGGSVPVTDAQRERSTAFMRRRPLALSRAVSVALGLLLLTLGAGAWYWDAFYREVEEYYANVTKRWGLPEGIGRLNADQVSRRSATVVLVRHGRLNPPQEIRVVNSAGLTPPVGSVIPLQSVAELNPLANIRLDSPASSELVQLTRVTFSRDASGRVLEQAGFNRGGRRLYTIHFAEPNVGEYKWHGFGMPVRESGITYLRVSRVASGRNAGLDERIQYLDNSQRPQPDGDGQYGYRLVLTATGLVTEWVHLGPDGRDKANNYGVLKEIRSHDALGNILEATTVDEHGSPKSSRTGPASTRIQYDRSGNPTRMSLFDEKGQPVVSRSVGAASIGLTYDRRGYLLAQTFFGPDQKLVVGQSGFAKQTAEWQSATRSLARFYGASEQPIPALQGAFEGLITWEARGYPIEITYRDDKGNATRAADGCATVRMHYDDVGNLGEISCLNEQGTATISMSGYSSVKLTSDAFGNPVMTAFYDLQGKPRLIGDLYASVRRTFSASGNVERETFLDAKGAPVRNRLGFASVTHHYDASGNRVATLYWDEHDGRATSVDGYSAIRRKFNERRLEIETAYFDSRDKSIQSADGYATVRYEYDQRNFVDRILFLGTDGRPRRGFDGYSSARIKHNEAGQRLEMTFFGENGAPTVADRFGSTKRRWTYDGAGRIAERSDHDATGRPVINRYGYSIVKYRYDEHGRENGRELLDSERRKLAFKVSVDRVAGGSVASEAGLKVGDVILTYDGQTVLTSDQFINTLELFRGDRSRELRIERGQRVLSLDVGPGRLHGLELAERVPVINLPKAP